MNEDISYLDLDKKVKDLQALRSSLRREIDQNQMEATNLRDGLRALGEKSEEAKKELLKAEAVLIERRNEISSIDALLDKERKIIEAEKRDLVAQRDGTRGEQEIFQKEKAGALEAINEQRSKLAKLEVSLNERSKELDVRDKEIIGQLQEISNRRVKIQELEVKVSSKTTDASKTRDDAYRLFKDASKQLDEAKAERVRYEFLAKETKDKQADFAERENTIRIALDDVELRRLQLNDRERDLSIEAAAVQQAKSKLLKEIEASRIPDTKKAEIKKDI